MADPARYFITTAIDYPNSRPHIGTAFEKLGADVQARYRRMEGYDVFFLMGNDENTVKVSRTRRRAGAGAEGVLRRHGPAVQGSLEGARHQLRRLHPDAASRAITPAAASSSRRCTTTATSTRAATRAWYCEGCEEFKTEKEIKEAGGVCPDPQDAAGAAQRAVLLTSRCRRSSDQLLDVLRGRTRTSFSRRAGATRSSPWSRRNCATSTSRARRRRGAFACRSTRSSRSTSGSTPC